MSHSEFHRLFFFLNCKKLSWLWLGVKMLLKHHVMSASSYLLCKLMLNNLSERKACFVRPAQLQPGVIEPTNLVYCWKWTTHDVNGLHGAPLNDCRCKSTRWNAIAVLCKAWKQNCSSKSELEKLRLSLQRKKRQSWLKSWCVFIVPRWTCNIHQQEPFSCITSPQYCIQTIQE